MAQEIHDEGNQNPDLVRDTEDDPFAYADEEEEEEEGEAEAADEFDPELMEEASDKLGLTEAQAQSLGEDSVQSLLDKVTPVKTLKPNSKSPRPTSKTRVKDVDLDDEFDERLVEEMKYDRKLLQELSAKLDNLGAAQQSRDMDTMRDTLKEVAKGYPKLSGAMKREAQNVVAALKVGFPAGEMPSDQELAEMALRSVGGKATKRDRSSQFLAKPSHRKQAKSDKPADRRDNAIRNVKAFMEDNGMID